MCIRINTVTEGGSGFIVGSIATAYRYFRADGAQYW